MAFGPTEGGGEGVERRHAFAPMSRRSARLNPDLGDVPPPRAVVPVAVPPPRPLEPGVQDEERPVDDLWPLILPYVEDSKTWESVRRTNRRSAALPALPHGSSWAEHERLEDYYAAMFASSFRDPETGAQTGVHAVADMMHKTMSAIADGLVATLPRALDDQLVELQRTGRDDLELTYAEQAKAFLRYHFWHAMYSLGSALMRIHAFQMAHRCNDAIRTLLRGSAERNGRFRIFLMAAANVDDDVLAGEVDVDADADGRFTPGDVNHAYQIDVEDTYNGLRMRREFASPEDVSDWRGFADARYLATAALASKGLAYRRGWIGHQVSLPPDVTVEENVVVYDVEVPLVLRNDTSVSLAEQPTFVLVHVRVAVYHDDGSNPAHEVQGTIYDVLQQLGDGHDDGNVAMKRFVQFNGITAQDREVHIALRDDEDSWVHLEFTYKSAEGDTAFVYQWSLSQDGDANSAFYLTRLPSIERSRIYHTSMDDIDDLPNAMKLVDGYVANADARQFDPDADKLFEWPMDGRSLPTPPMEYTAPHSAQVQPVDDGQDGVRRVLGASETRQPGYLQGMPIGHGITSLDLEPVMFVELLRLVCAPALLALMARTPVNVTSVVTFFRPILNICFKMLTTSGLEASRPWEYYTNIARQRTEGPALPTATYFPHYSAQRGDDGY